jgi:hypothetical protein
MRCWITNILKHATSNRLHLTIEVYIGFVRYQMYKIQKKKPKNPGFDTSVY